MTFCHLEVDRVFFWRECINRVVSKCGKLKRYYIYLIWPGIIWVVKTRLWREGSIIAHNSTESAIVSEKENKWCFTQIIPIVSCLVEFCSRAFKDEKNLSSKWAWLQFHHFVVLKNSFHCFFYWPYFYHFIFCTFLKS